ncbi:MAG: cupin domain-containing protein [Alphaproteobacteria bacterium]
MLAYDLEVEKIFDPKKHVEKILDTVEDGDVTVACWEPGQTSPNHCHPECTEIYFCWQGGGIMRTPDETIEVKPGSFVVHPPGEVHEYENGQERSLLFRVRYGADTFVRIKAWPSNSEFEQTAEDVAYFEANPS